MDSQISLECTAQTFEHLGRSQVRLPLFFLRRRDQKADFPLISSPGIGTGLKEAAKGYAYGSEYLRS